MTKSKIKRFRNYNEDYDDEDGGYYDHREHIKEKHLKSALRSKNLDALLDLEDDY